MRVQDLYFPAGYPNSTLLNEAIATLKSVRRDVLEMVRGREGLEHSYFKSRDGEVKDMLLVDKAAENACRRTLYKKFGGPDQLLVLGEETLWKLPSGLDLSRQTIHLDGSTPIINTGVPETRLTAILDMIDGSDLLERGFGNWCSALVFFQPTPSPKILFSMVQDAMGNIYGADERATFLIKPAASPSPMNQLCGPEVRILHPPENQKDRQRPEYTDQIAICFYAQKRKHFISISERFRQWVSAVSAERLRVYTLAGNPMMVKLANGEHIHAVFEHRGQYPHDMVPGAYIALKAGAHLLDRNGDKIDDAALARSLLQPAGAKLQYVLAATPEIGHELAPTLLTEDELTRE